MRLGSRIGRCSRPPLRTHPARRRTLNNRCPSSARSSPPDQQPQPTGPQTEGHERDPHLCRDRELHLHGGAPVDAHVRVPAVGARGVGHREVRVDIVDADELAPARRAPGDVVEGQRGPVPDEADDGDGAVHYSGAGAAC